LEYLSGKATNVFELKKIALPSRRDYIRLRPYSSKTFTLYFIPVELDNQIISIIEPKRILIKVLYCDKVLRKRNAIKIFDSEHISLLLQRI
jgi:hypothetical protein